MKGQGPCNSLTSNIYILLNLDGVFRRHAFFLKNHRLERPYILIQCIHVHEIMYNIYLYL